MFFISFEQLLEIDPENSATLNKKVFTLNNIGLAMSAQKKYLESIY